MTAVARGLPGPLPGLDPAWSRHVTAPDAEGRPRRWHLLDTGEPEAGTAVGTVLCLHGNPTWSYLWRRVLAEAPPGWRVVAPDQLGMGLSEQAPPGRTLPQRVEDLSRLTEALRLTGPVVLLAHDWGGPVGLGWALRHDVRARLAGVVLTNTAVHHPGGARVPAPIRLARSSPLLDLTCRRTPAFVAAAAATCRPPLPGPVRQGLAAPYDSAERRQGVADFVRDIPLEPEHPSTATLQHTADRLAAGDLADVPVLLLWGTRDPVFTERYLRDLIARLPHADVHRVVGASHLVLEDHPAGVGTIWAWVTRQRPGPVPAQAPEASRSQPADGAGAPAPLPVALDAHDPVATALVELAADGRSRTVTSGELDRRVR
ncbi:alpha/beta fold hydrolase, partial [Ornithinicoccus halotolerans]|uniref:alpha/beta fold hydrolase n=1 Tax=Ornithinicoccus halotolerans TaxID=1748220 RepID=UPI001E5A3AE7